MSGYKELTRNDGLDDFGNLCLISRGMNSKFSNNMPEAKCNNFGKDQIVVDLSIKLQEMMEVVGEENIWGVEQIKAFEKKVRENIENALK